VEIIAKNICKTVNGIPLLDHLSLKVKKAEIYGLIGPNGAGKTTLIRSLLGIYEIHSGLITIAGVESSNSDFVRIKRKIACLFDHLGLYKDLSAWENLEFFHRIYFPRSNKRVRKAEIERLLRKMKIIVNASFHV
jgi:ABC-2 type transport system ATP-binding protein